MARVSVRQRGLFGGYVPPPRDPRGRKRIEWNKQTAENVTLLAARRATQEEIAEAVGLSVKTLTRIYAGELAHAADVIRQAVFGSLVRRAVEDGSTPAAKCVLAILDEQDVADGMYKGAARRRPAAQPRLGKKEQRQVDAQQALGGIYAPGAPPTQKAH